MTAEHTGMDQARAVADAVLYEGYLLYPYRATSSKNQARWQFGVLGPPGAEPSGLGEDPSISAQLLVHHGTGLRFVVRFLHLQHRRAERTVDTGGYEHVDTLTTPTGSWLTWDEAIATELSYGPWYFTDEQCSFPVSAPSTVDIEELAGGRLVRERHGVHGLLEVAPEAVAAEETLHRVTVTVRNTGAAAADRRDAIARSMIGTHVLVEAVSGGFVSLLEPPDNALSAARGCEHHRCFPVLAGPAGCDELALISPIILYDHPEIAEASRGDLFDATEIDEILTLRVMTMTDDEKAQARATDPRAARIIDQCDGMSVEAMMDLHGVLRDPHADPDAGRVGLIPAIPEGVDWWDPLADNAVAPDVDGVLINGVRVARGSRVRLRPRRRADAQDMFVAGKAARVTSVHEDVEGGKHVGVVVEDHPDAALPESYGRYLYFSPDEIEPLPGISP